MSKWIAEFELEDGDTMICHCILGSPKITC